MPIRSRPAAYRGVVTFSGPLTRWFTEGTALDPDGFLPPGFAASVRVLHPPRHQVAEDVWVPVTWAEVAERNGRVIGDMPDWYEITGPDHGRSDQPQPGLWESAPWEGGVAPLVLPELSKVLATHTASGVPTYVAMWFGFGGRLSSTELTGKAVVEQLNVGGGRQYDVFPAAAGVVERLVEAGEGPNLWWPADHTWCATTEIDSMFTAVGGSTALIADLHASGLEVQPRH